MCCLVVLGSGSPILVANPRVLDSNDTQPAKADIARRGQLYPATRSHDIFA